VILFAESGKWRTLVQKASIAHLLGTHRRPKEKGGTTAALVVVFGVSA
jgi:hypothetical protein